MTTETANDRRGHLGIPHSHYVSAAAYNDEEVFEVERERILDRVWRLLCHESELPEKYDFRTFDHVGLPLLTIRGGDGKIRSFVNVCSHRGAKLVNDVSGNAQQLRCFYHHWTYDSEGNCIGIPRSQAYEACGLEQQNCGLREIMTEAKLGLVFFNLDRECKSLDEHLGDALESMEQALAVNLEVIHFNRTIVKGNWKDWQATNMEPYHEFMHAVVRQTNIMTEEAFAQRSILLYPNGHARFLGMTADYDAYDGTRTRVRKECLPGVDPDGFQSVPLFPNGVIATRGTVMRIDITHPISPFETLVECRGLAPKADSKEEREMRISHHNEFWGPFSPNMPEDGYGVEALGKGFGLGGAKAQIIAREEGLRAQDDGIMRGFYAEWGRLMGVPPGAAERAKP